MIGKLTNSSEFNSKIEKLESVKSQLKKEFFGIDEVIDKIVDLISSWYTLPQLQTKPLIVNLWGMTGIGKTSLIEKLVSLLELEEAYFPFDLGEKKESHTYGMRSQLEDIYKLHENKSLILSFDEFQYARSINEDNHEITDSASRIIWQIMGSGKFSFSSSYNDLYEIARYTKLLKYQLLKGVKVVNGEVITEPQKFETDIERTSLIYSSLTEGTSFFSAVYLDSLFEISEPQFSDQLELAEYLMRLDGYETIALLEDIINKATVVKSVDCSKALIFVIGNLDEAYTISGNFNPDISADIFYEETKKISLTKIKKVLKMRFRNEQIARLGNNHVIYPSLNSKAFNSIIDEQLCKAASLIKERFMVELDFDESVKELIYKEGVLPTQGARPLHTTIDNIVGSNISKLLYNAVKKNVKFDFIQLSAKEEHLIAEYYLTGLKKGEYKIKLNLLTENRRKSKNDELQVITAVHESGHAIVLKALLGINPDGVISVSADDDTHGITIVSSKDDSVISKRRIVDENAVTMAGIIAEKIIFGEENVTNGSISDFERATEFTALMIKKAGLGNQLGSYDIDQNYLLSDKKLQLEEEIKEILKLASEKAKEVLENNYELLLKLSEYLSVHSYISKEDFLEIYNKYAKQSYSRVDDNFYRRLLSGKIQQSSQFKLQFTGTDD